MQSFILMQDFQKKELNRGGETGWAETFLKKNALFHKNIEYCPKFLEYVENPQVTQPN